MTCPQEIQACAALNFFDVTYDDFLKAGRSAGRTLNRYFQIGERIVQLSFAGDVMINRTVPALAHLETRPQERVDFTVCIFDSESTNTQIRLPVIPTSYNSQGEAIVFNNERVYMRYEPNLNMLHVMDTLRSTAIFWTQSIKTMPWWESSFPLRSIIHWYLEKSPFQPIHAGAVGFPEGGVLITGKAGSGKSTATLACLDSELYYAGDDYVLVKLEPAPFVYSLYNVAKIDPPNLDRFPHLKSEVKNADRCDSEKAMVFLAETRSEKLIKSFPLRAILISQITGIKDTRLRRVKEQESLKAIAPTTIFHLQGDHKHTFAKIGELVRRVPSYILEAGTDLLQIPKVISELLRDKNNG